MASKPRLTPALPALHLAQPAPGALASLLSLRLTELTPTSRPLHLPAPLPRALFPRASQGCLLHSGLSPQVSPPQTGHPSTRFKQKPGASRSAITLFISFKAHTTPDLHCSGSPPNLRCLEHDYVQYGSHSQRLVLATGLHPQ